MALKKYLQHENDKHKMLTVLEVCLLTAGRSVETAGQIGKQWPYCWKAWLKIGDPKIFWWLQVNEKEMLSATRKLLCKSNLHMTK